MSSQKEQGFIHLLGILVIAGLFISALIPISRYYNDGKSAVAGISLAAVNVSSNSANTIGQKNMMKKEDFNIATSGGQTALVNKRVGALSTFPLSVNSTTGQLTVTTTAGSKIVTVLPQQAIDNMLAARVMTDVEGVKVNNDLASIPNLVNLEIKNGVLGYQVKGTKTHKLLGFIPIKTGVEAFVSAENGQVVESTDSLLGRILNRLDP